MKSSTVIKPTVVHAGSSGPRGTTPSHQKVKGEVNASQTVWLACYQRKPRLADAGEQNMHLLLMNVMQSRWNYPAIHNSFEIVLDEPLADQGNTLLQLPTWNSTCEC